MYLTYNAMVDSMTQMGDLKVDSKVALAMTAMHINLVQAKMSFCTNHFTKEQDSYKDDAFNYCFTF